MADDGDAELHERILSQILAVLRGADQRRYDLDEGEYLCIQGARDEAATWKQIAEALGLDSPQAAQQRYERLGKRLGGPRSLVPVHIDGMTCDPPCEDGPCGNDP